MVIDGWLWVQVTRLRADGTLTAVATNGVLVQRLSGRYAYARGGYTAWYTNGWFQRHSVSWVTSTTVICRVLRTNNPWVAGREFIARRVE
jgi:hypothetical protein